MSSSSASVRNYTREKSAICFEFRDGDIEDVHRAKVDPSDPYLDGRVQEVDRDAREFGVALPELPTPGSGEQYRNSCGQDMPVAYCDNPAHKQVWWSESSCRRSRCPHSWQAWDFHAAKAKVAKLEGLRRYRMASGTDSKLHHLTASVRKSTRLDSGQPLDRMIEVVKELMQTCNVDTGYILYHPWRIKKEYRGNVLGHESGEGDMTWKDIIPLIEDGDWDAVCEEYLTYAPHFHVVGLSPFAQGGELTKEIEERTGIVIERITEHQSSVSISGLAALCRVMMYGLSHVGLEEHSESWQAVCRPFGEVADFEAFANVQAEVDEVMRQNAFQVLGVDFPDRPDTCRKTVEMEATETVSTRTESAITAAEADTGTAPGETMGELWGAGGGSEGVPDTRPVSQANVTVERERQCLGDVHPMYRAPRHIDDLEWRQEAADEVIAHLEECYEAFQALDDVDDITSREEMESRPTLPEPPP